MSHVPRVLFSDADPDDTGDYALEVGNDSGVADLKFGVKVKGGHT